jgi:hypothetical protein
MSRTSLTSVRLSPRNLSSAIANMSNKQMEWFKQTGFGGLINFKLTMTPHNIAFKILKAYNMEEQALELQDKRIYITEETVSDVLGFPRGQRPVTTIQEAVVYENWQAHFSKWPGRITIGDVCNMIKTSKTASDDFKRSFLVVLANTLVSPPIGPYVNKELVGFDGDLDRSYEYNWCAYVLANLNRAVKDWRINPKNPFTGPLLFIVVSTSAYFSYLNRFI